VSAFGGPAWTRVPDGQWYLHLFARQQPDLNWTNPEVHADLEQTMRFWLDRRVDGFRIDVAHGMAKAPGLPDMDPHATPLSGNDSYDPRFDDDGVHDIHQMIRKALDEYPDTMAAGEIWVTGEDRLARYLRPDELHLAFDSRLVLTHFDADAMRATIDRSLNVPLAVGAPSTSPRSHGKATSRRSGSPAPRTPGCRCRRSGRR
jgi:alpha-glucosidase